MAGSFYLCDPFYNAIDLDTVIIGNFFFLEPENSLAGADITLGWSTASPFAWIVRAGENKLRGVETTAPPTLEECRSRLEEYPYGGVTISAGDVPEILDEFGCLQTDQGRLGYIQVEEINPIGSLSVKLSFVLWNADASY